MRYRLVARPAHILETSRVFPDSEVNAQAAQWLADLEAYQVAHVGVTPYPQQSQLHVRAVLLRR
jgi:hypothetical protein